MFREADAEGRPARAEGYRAVRDGRTIGPLAVLTTTHDLIASLTAGRWDATTEARPRGATWDQIAHAMNEPTDEVRNEYAAIVRWCAEH